MSRELLKQALDALDALCASDYRFGEELMDAIEAELAKPDQAAADKQCIRALSEERDRLVGMHEERYEKLKCLVVATHKAKGRYHSQLAFCDLYEACGLLCVRPVKDKA